jgi:hypothetical protein
MLEIILNKTFSLQLPEDVSIPFIDENPLFLEDRIPVAHTVSFNVPKTPENMFFFGFPNRPSTARIMDKYEADIYHFGSIILEGEIILIDVQETINLQFINAFMPSDAKKPLNMLDFGERDFGTAQANAADLNYVNSMYDAYEQAIYDSTVTPGDFVTAPVRLQSVEWDGHIAAWGLKNAVSMYINYFNPIDQSWDMPPTPQMLAYAIFPIMPFPYVHFLLTKFFGDRLEINPFYEDINLRKLVMICFNHKNFRTSNFYKANDAGRIFYVWPLVDDYTAISGLFQNKWSMQSFMQQYQFNEFFKSILTLFGMSCLIGRKIELIYNKDLLLTEDIFDLTPFILADPVISYQKGKIYVLSYGQEKTTETNSIAVHMQSGSVSDAYFDILSSAELTKNYKISDNPNVVYELTKKAVGIPPSGQDQKFVVTSKIITSALATDKYEPVDYEEDSMQAHEVRVDVKPLENNIEHYWNEMFNGPEEAINKGHWFVPVLPDTDLKAPPYIMLDNGIQPGISNQNHTYRQLLNHHTNAQGVKEFNLSLLINKTDPDSVFMKYHQEMAEWHKRDKVKMTVEAILTPLQLKQISNKMKIHVAGRNFHIIKREYTLSKTRFIKVTFDLIEAFSVLSEPVGS